MRLVLLRAGARRARRLLLLAGLVFAALPAGSALADTTIGQTGGDPDECVGPIARADTNYLVPAGGGQIIDFSFESNSASPGGGFPGNAGQQLDFLVLRPAGGSNYTVVGKTGLVTLRGTGLNTFPVNIPVQGGDILGVWHPSDLAYCLRSTASGGEIDSDLGAPDPNVGDTVSLPIQFSGTDSSDLNESANFVPAVSLPPPPTSKQQCKHGGWKNFGSRFKNQGQCVSFVEHQHHKHHRSGSPARVWGS
jgi:hypothetical protein